LEKYREPHGGRMFGTSHAYVFAGAPLWNRAGGVQRRKIAYDGALD
jgi:hypothetical protein